MLIRKLGTPHGNGAHRITIPNQFLKQLGWKKGDDLQVSMIDNFVVVRKVEKSVKDVMHDDC